MTDRIFVFDTTLRDGEQAAGVCFSRRDKIEIAERLAQGLTDALDAPARARWPLDPDAEKVRGAGVKA